jgi:hypothetical protein
MNAYARELQRDTTAKVEASFPRMEARYRDYVADVDKKIAAAQLEFYRQRAAKEDYLNIPGQDFATMDIPAYVEEVYANSVFTSYEKMTQANLEQIMNDPAVGLYSGIYGALMKRYQSLYGSPNRPRGAASNTDVKYNEARKHFAGALLEWQDGKAMYPDANSTMRLTYGTVLPYSPKDALVYKYYTTAQGLLEKEDPTNPEFILPADVKTLIKAGDYGRWADEDGTLHTCFLTNNDITGGNSGSPVLDAKGNLIGLAFDGNWESMSSDVMFEPALQRCICVDIRYVLWMVEKVGGATNIINELTYAK